MSSKMAWFAVAMTILLNIAGQLITRSRAMHVVLPDSAMGKVAGILKLLTDPWIILSLAAAFLAGLFWIAAMTRLPLTTAYPFMTLPFVFVSVLGAIYLGEPLGVARVLGIALVMAGFVVLARAG